MIFLNALLQKKIIIYFICLICNYSTFSTLRKVKSRTLKVYLVFTL